MQSQCDDSDRKRSHQQFGRHQPGEHVSRDGHCVLLPHSNVTYVIDLSKAKMQQRNLKTKKIRAVSWNGQAGWHWDKNATGAASLGSLRERAAVCPGRCLRGSGES